MAEGFNLEGYLRNSKAVEINDLPWDTVRDHPLREGEVRFLQYMMNIESHTIVYLKELRSTKVIEDAEVTAFLSCWAYEEFFHGAALERLLKTYVGPQNVRNEAGYRIRQTGAVGRFAKKLVTPLVSAASPDFAAVHMTWGAAQEITTLHGYEAVARQTEHPLLKELMGRIVKDERRHFAFYYNQANLRLKESAFMQKETRFAMNKLWRPVGVGAMPDRESDFAGWLLFRDEEGQKSVAHIEETMGRLPGMAGWDKLGFHLGKAIQRVEARTGEVAAAAQRRVPIAA